MFDYKLKTKLSKTFFSPFSFVHILEKERLLDIHVYLFKRFALLNKNQTESMDLQFKSFVN